MTKQVLLYERAVPLSSETHRDWSVKAGKDYGFAREVNAVPLTAVEISAAASEYPVIFAGKDDNIMPLALLGTRQGQNLYVGEDDAWTGRYVPAFLRRYPFIFATGADGKRFTLCIDESFEGCNQEGRGERLFDSEGERTQYLERVLGFLRDYEAHFQRTRAFCRKLKKLDLLDPMQVRATAPGSTQNAVTGFMAISRQKLKALDNDKLAEMSRTDELELVYLHLFSLRNFRTMLESSGAPAKDATDAVAPSMAEGEVAEGESAEGEIAEDEEKPPVH